MGKLTEEPPSRLLTISWFLRRYLLWIVCGAGHTRRPSAVRIRGQHPPLAGSVSAGPHAPPQRPALPAGHAGVRVDTHATPLRLREDQVKEAAAAAAAVALSSGFVCLLDKPLFLCPQGNT